MDHFHPLSSHCLKSKNINIVTKSYIQCTKFTMNWQNPNISTQQCVYRDHENITSQSKTIIHAYTLKTKSLNTVCVSVAGAFLFLDVFHVATSAHSNSVVEIVDEKWSGRRRHHVRWSQKNIDPLWLHALLHSLQQQKHNTSALIPKRIDIHPTKYLVLNCLWQGP